MEQPPGTFVLSRGWRPGLLGDAVAIQARYYATNWGFGPFFEARLAREMAESAGRYDPAHDLILSATGEDGRTFGSITIDGSDPAAAGGLLHLRWFVLGEGARGRGIGAPSSRRASHSTARCTDPVSTLWNVRRCGAASLRRRRIRAGRGGRRRDLGDARRRAALRA